ncbi:response regulator receiver domain-containing protein [Breoghania corrubedonensis]|uniref:Response regulator receiver domain-containing protein n=2 Tax=Breoghania corrubedonensis TaxID=665038 RepID=A0A2T5VAZ2_9HYPH|nr:response regulator receiver domain-containing protein [Breoghania corrubedonensis]
MRCGIDLAGLSFLVVDDSEFMRNAIRTVLCELGSARVAEAADGTQAFEQIAWEEPDIIICDWLMQPMGGEDFMRSLRADPTSPISMLPVIMLTSFSGRDHALTAARLGVNEFIEKPLTPGALARRIERIVTEDRPFIRVPGYFGPLPRAAGIDGAKLRAIAERQRREREAEAEAMRLQDTSRAA